MILVSHPSSVKQRLLPSNADGETLTCECPLLSSLIATQNVQMNKGSFYSKTNQQEHLAYNHVRNRRNIATETYYYFQSTYIYRV